MIGSGHPCFYCSALDFPSLERVWLGLCVHPLQGAQMTSWLGPCMVECHHLKRASSKHSKGSLMSHLYFQQQQSPPGCGCGAVCQTVGLLSFWFPSWALSLSMNGGFSSVPKCLGFFLKLSFVTCGCPVVGSSDIRTTMITLTKRQHQKDQSELTCREWHI